MLTEMKLDKALVGNRYTLLELEETLEALEGSSVGIALVDPTDTERYFEGEDYKMDIETKEGTGTIWYALTRDMRKLITEVEFSIRY
jgi:hypothetical protein